MPHSRRITGRTLRRLEGSPATLGGGRIGIVIALALLGVVFYFAWRTSRADEAGETVTLEERYERDFRIVSLIGDCPFQGAFEADTSDLASVLASKLDAGAQLEPLRRAKADLAKMGPAAAEPLLRLFQDASKDRYRSGVAKNVLVVCALAESDWGVPIALEALTSPAPDIRSDATIVIANHPAPEHYDTLEALLPGFRLPINVERCLKAMHACDPLRFARSIPMWVEAVEPEGFEEAYIQSTLIDTSVPLAANIEDEEIAASLLEVARTARGLLPRHTPYLIAPSARLGNELSLQDLKDGLANPQQKPRYHAVQALARAGFTLDTYPLAVTSGVASERASTLALILQNPYEEQWTKEQELQVTSWARKALADEAIEVREVALKGLLLRGDDEGFSALLNLLTGQIQDRGVGMRAMRGSFEGQRDKADQARSLLIGLWEREAQGAQRGAELTSILAAIGAIPGEASGRFALQCADALGGNLVRGDRGFHWAIGQAFNAGPEAQAVLRERMRVETDPFNRLDLLSFLWQDFSEESLSIILDVVEDKEQSPYERLYAASVSLRMGRSKTALPVLKRIYRTTEDPVLRSGVHCLLWIWFGPPLS